MPRFYKEAGAAAELGLELSQFRHLVSTGHLPPPLRQVGLYDIKALNAAVDRMSGIGHDKKDEAANALHAWRMSRRAG